MSNTAIKWDLRFLELAQLVAGWSKDPSTPCGAVIVDNDRNVVATGYNGFPAHMPDDPHLYADREQKYSRIIHCEMNALLRVRQAGARNCTLYTWPMLSCDRCAVHLLQAGIRRFVAPRTPGDKLERWGKTLDRSVRYIEEAGGYTTFYDLDNTW